MHILTHIARKSGSVAVGQRFVRALRAYCHKLAGLPDTLGHNGVHRYPMTTTGESMREKMIGGPDPRVADFHYVGIDLADEMLQRAQQSHAEPHAAFAVMDIEHLAFKQPNYFDLCLSLFGSFSYVLQPSLEAIPALYRVIKPQGHVFIMVYSRFSLKNWYDAFASRDLSRLAAVHPYACRNACPAQTVEAKFYTRAAIIRAFRCFAPLNIYGLNGCLELPWMKAFLRSHGQRSAVQGLAVAHQILAQEQRWLRCLPSCCHSLIIHGRKP